MHPFHTLFKVSAAFFHVFLQISLATPSRFCYNVLKKLHKTDFTHTMNI